jgi:hypothetical protein
VGWGEPPLPVYLGLHIQWATRSMKNWELVSLMIEF